MTEPPVWSVVKALGKRWVRVPQLHDPYATYWVRFDDPNGDPESWGSINCDAELVGFLYQDSALNAEFAKSLERASYDR